MTWFWLAFALIAVTIELLSPLFVFGFVLLGGSALVGAAIAALGHGLLPQLGAFGLSALFSLTILRSRLMHKFIAVGVPSRTDRLIGKSGQVTEAIETHLGKGRVTVEGTDWAARSDESLPAGARVLVKSADGIALNVTGIGK